MQVLEDPVVVRRGEEQSPEQFLWRGRLWLVREVLDRPRSAPGGAPGAADADDAAEVWRVRAAAGRLAALLQDVAGGPASGAIEVDLSYDWVTGDWWLAEVTRR